MKRDHLKIFASPSVVLSQNSAQLQHSWEGSGVEPDTFTSMLTNLVHSRRMASTARAVGAAFRELIFVVAHGQQSFQCCCACCLQHTCLPQCSDAPGILHCAACSRGSSSVMSMTGRQAWRLAVPQAFCLHVMVSSLVWASGHIRRGGTLKTLSSTSPLKEHCLHACWFPVDLG